MAERERSTPRTRREKRERARTLKAAEEKGALSIDFMKARTPRKRHRGRKKG